MGIFDKKTSTDYLKSISKSMKQSQKYEEQVSAAQEEAAYAEARAARARAAVSDAQADEIRERTNLQKLTEEKLDLSKRKMALDSFLSSFDYDIDSPEDIAQKALKMIAWLDNVDRTFKNKSRKYELLNETFDDSDKFKEGLLRKRLVEANQQLNKLGYKENKANYIAQKIEFYDNRDIQEREEIARRKKIRNDKIKKYLKSTTIVVVFMWLLGLIFTAPTTKNNHDKCVKKVLSCVDKGNLIKAENVLLPYNSTLFTEESFNWGSLKNYKRAIISLDIYDENIKDDLLDNYINAYKLLLHPLKIFEIPIDENYIEKNKGSLFEAGYNEKNCTYNVYFKLKDYLSSITDIDRSFDPEYKLQRNKLKQIEKLLVMSSLKFDNMDTAKRYFEANGFIPIIKQYDKYMIISLSKSK